MLDTAARPATTPRRTFRPATLAALAAALSTAALGVAGGCDKGETRTYEAPKGSAAPTPAAATAAKGDPHAVPPAAGASTTSDPAAAGPAAAGPVAGPVGPGAPPAGPAAGGPPMGMGAMMAAPINEAELAKPSDKDEPVTLGAIKAVVPAGWRQENKQRMMREGTFVVGDLAKNTTVIISRFGGGAGGLKENLNRWRGQVKLPPADGTVNEADFPKVKISGTDAMLLDVTGPADQPPVLRLIQAVAPRQGSVYYIKIIGDAATVGAHKAEFDKFLGSIQFAE